MNERIKNDIKLLPENSGCYLMYDSSNLVIYVGKAKNLKKRVSQYFLKPQSGKTFSMVNHVSFFETILTETEKEAFVLEMNLIKKYKPKYNILLVDDKHYPYIEIHKEKYPYISISRKVNNDKNLYFGPYPSSKQAYILIDLLNDIFKLRRCKKMDKYPCFYYHIDSCLAPCVNKIDENKYKDIINKITKVLKGDNDYLINKIKDKILYLSSNLDYEKAKEYKGKLDSIIYIKEHQNVEFLDLKDRDFIGFYICDNILSIYILIYRNGTLIGNKKMCLEIIGELNEFLSSILLQYYYLNIVPKYIYVSSNELCNTLKNNLKSAIIKPTRGKNLNIINNAILNAKTIYLNYINNKNVNLEKIKTLNKLENILKIDSIHNIEIFDNSHLQGTSAIGAMLSYIDGEEIKENRRKFNINSLNKKDDLSSMKEVIYRRYSRLKENNELMPDLIIVDGGEEQVEITIKVINDLSLNIYVMGLKKDDKHRTKYIIDNKLNTIEIKDKDLFLLLSSMQNDIHNYAILTHIKKRNKDMFKSIFDDIKGVGLKRKEMIISLYPTLNDLKNVKIEELEQILPSKIAIELKNKIDES